MKPFLFAWIITLRGCPFRRGCRRARARRCRPRRRRRSACTGSSRRVSPVFGRNAEHARRVQAVERFARPRIVRLGVADAPVHEIELRIVRAGSPRRSAAVLPRVAVLRPRLRSRLARRGNRVAPPQLLSGLRIPSDRETRASSTRRRPCRRSRRRWRRWARWSRSSLLAQSANVWFQTCLPVFMSSATTWLSIGDAEYSLPL